MINYTESFYHNPVYRNNFNKNRYFVLGQDGPDFTRKERDGPDSEYYYFTTDSTKRIKTRPLKRLTRTDLFNIHDASSITKRGKRSGDHAHNEQPEKTIASTFKKSFYF